MFANLKGNIGDFAILHAILEDVVRKFPGRQIHVYPHGYYDVDEGRLAVFIRRCGVNFEIAGYTYFSDMRNTPRERLSRMFGLWPRVQADRVLSLANRVAQDAARFKDYEAIFLAGGEHWGGTKGGISMFGTLNAVHQYNEKIYAYPFSVNPRITRFNSAEALQRNFDKIQKPLVVRDGSSQKVLDEVGVASVLGSDCVYSLGELADEIEPQGQHDHSRIILAVTGSKNHFDPDLRTGLKQLRDFDREISLLTTCEYEDGKRCEAIARDFNVSYCAPLTWQDAVAEMKASSLVVTNRLHGLILASIAGTPLLPVTNRSKAKSFVTDAEIPYSLGAITEINLGILDRCHRERHKITEKVRTYKARMLTAPYGPALCRKAFKASETDESLEQRH
jgi:polysaccharide pyruvyl transferase WcaK-like protein